jgi:hypothetical protein
MVELVLLASLVIASPDKAKTFCPGDVVEVWEHRPYTPPGRWRRRIVIAGWFGLEMHDEEWNMFFPIENLANRTWRFVAEEQVK